MIVKEDSILCRIPREIPADEALTFEGMRYSANMALLSYGRLRGALHQISLKNELPDFRYDAINAAWGIIDSFCRFYKISKRILRGGTHPLELKYQQLHKLRNGFQHIDEWIDEKHVEEHYPIFGVLAWVYWEPELNDSAKIFNFIPGLQVDSKNYPVPNPLGRDFRPPIDHIILTANQKAKGTPVIQIEIVSLIKELEDCVRQFEKVIDNAFSVLKNREDIFSSDIVMEITMT